MYYFLIVLVLLTVLNGVFLVWCVYGWKKLKTIHAHANNNKTFVSVIVPARNEEENISDCLYDILRQNYPITGFEVIVSDDHSTDGTVEKVRIIMNEFPDHRIRLISNEQNAGVRYKKQAISAAVHQAIGELIVTTDADCRMSPRWLQAIVGHYEKEQPDMIAGPVCYDREKNMFEKMQGLEFSGLVGIGAGTLSNRMPMMCNGGNLAYSKKIFQQVSGFTDKTDFVSGDDTQLMLKIAKIDPSRIHFLKSPDAVVYTTAVNSLSGFIHQRKRWASKIPFAMNAFTVAIAANAYLLHIGLLILFVCAFFRHGLISSFLLLLFIKGLPEIWLLSNVNSFFKKKNRLWLFLPAQIFYLFYISFIGAVSVSGSYTWKERKIKPTAVKLPVS